MMNRLSRYLFMECGRLTVIALLVMTVLIMLPRVLNLLDLWINSGVSVTVLLRVVLLAMPAFLVGTLPLAMVVGILMALERMGRESELIIFRASGLSLYGILRPIAVLALCFTLFAMFLNQWAVPRANHRFAGLKKALATSTLLAIRPGLFADFEGVILHVQALDAERRLYRGIVIRDQRDAGKPSLLAARTARVLLREDGGVSLLLRDGFRFRQLGAGQQSRFNFDAYHFDLDVIPGLHRQPHEKKWTEMSTGELQAVIDAGGGPGRAARVVWHQRLAFPFATLILAMLAVPPGLRQFHRWQRSRGFVLAIATVLFHYILLSTGRILAEKGVLPPLFGLWLPNLFMAIVMIRLTITANRRDLLTVPFRRPRPVCTPGLEPPLDGWSMRGRAGNRSSTV